MHKTQKKDQYALRAIFELAKRRGEGPCKISEIARAQSIPLRFLEVILSQLKGSGFVASKRGFYGGYYLIQSPKKISVGDVFRYTRGEIDKKVCITCITKTDCPFLGHCAFEPLWNKALDAVYSIYDATTIQDLLETEQKKLKVLKLKD
jgi:Rrf2 family protein